MTLLISGTTHFLTSTPGTVLVSITTLVLLASLTFKETMSGYESVAINRLKRVLNICLVPLLFIFVVTVAAKIAEALSNIS